MKQGLGEGEEERDRKVFFHKTGLILDHADLVLSIHVLYQAGARYDTEFRKGVETALLNIARQGVVLCRYVQTGGARMLVGANKYFLLVFHNRKREEAVE